MWSIGVIAYTLITKHHPFKIFREEGFKDDLKNYSINKTDIFECGEFKVINNPHAKEFLKGLLNENFKADKDHGGRWSTDDATSCEWITSISHDLQY